MLIAMSRVKPNVSFGHWPTLSSNGSFELSNLTQRRMIMPSTKDIAKDFTALCKQGQFDEAGEKYWAKDVVSLEPMEGTMARAEGIDALRAKSEWWYGAHDIHNVEVGEPHVNGDQFMLRFSMDVTNKESGERMLIDENAVYTVESGKIVEERFFYDE
jgi:hypothetical protein